MIDTDVFLDVDGVLNAYSWGPSMDLKEHWHADPVNVEAQGFRILYFEELITGLNAFSKLPNVHFYWLTTWCEAAPNDLCAKIGLEGQDWPVLGADLHRSYKQRGWWKAEAVERHLESATSDRSIWVDDDIPYSISLGEVDTDLMSRHHVKMIAPVGHRGITPAMLHDMQQWAGVDTAG